LYNPLMNSSSRHPRRSAASWLGAPLALCLLIWAPSAATAPDIVLIVADDLGVGDLSAYGSRTISTPQIDRLAAMGIMARDAHATAAVCSPSRYSLLTGEYFQRSASAGQAWLGENMLAPGQSTIATALQSRGYYTAYFGKWHLGWGERTPDRRHRADIDWNGELPRGVLEAGFDDFFGTPFTHNEPPFVFIENRRVLGLEPDDPLVVVPRSQDRRPYGWGYSHGASAAHAARPEEQVDLLVTEKLLGELQRERSQPRFLLLSLVAPHVPHRTAPRFEGSSTLGRYGDVVRQLDWIVGRVIDSLVASGRLGRTLIVFTSDNGGVHYPGTYARGHRVNGQSLGQKTDAWAGGTRVPLIISWPGRVRPGTGTDALVSLVDLPATLLAATGRNTGAGPGRDGVNQLPTLLGRDDAAPRVELLLSGITGQALRRGNWAYQDSPGSGGRTTNALLHGAVKFADLGISHSDYDSEGKRLPGAPREQLYDLAQDPGQRNNVVSEFPDIAREMAARMEQLKDELGR
jgi:arylsulfatase A-like enzyme